MIENGVHFIGGISQIFAVTFLWGTPMACIEIDNYNQNLPHLFEMIYMRKKIFFILFPILISSQSFYVNAQPEQDKVMCKYAADHMIQVAKQSLSENMSRPERIEKRRKLVEEWTSRMESGEDPCTVYADIQKSANTF